jgi:cytochrome bd-type quinol oxidase subunit 2
MQKKLTLLFLFLCCSFSYASSGKLEDSIADVASWIILLILPAAGIYLFWKVHIYPEKVAEKKNHPQLSAIKSMCLLSLIFGGLLWPVALIWANYNYGNDPQTSPENKETEEKEKRVSEETKNVEIVEETKKPQE